MHSLSPGSLNCSGPQPGLDVSCPPGYTPCCNWGGKGWDWWVLYSSNTAYCPKSCKARPGQCYLPLPPIHLEQLSVKLCSERPGRERPFFFATEVKPQGLERLNNSPRSSKACTAPCSATATCLVPSPGQGQLVPASCGTQNQRGWWGLSACGRGKPVLLGEAAWWGSAPLLPPLHPPAAGFYSDRVPAFPHGPACT